MIASSIVIIQVRVDFCLCSRNATASSVVAVPDCRQYCIHQLLIARCTFTSTTNGAQFLTCKGKLFTLVWLLMAAQ